MSTRAEQRTKRDREKWWRAEDEAKALREVERLRREEGRTIGDALELAGLTMSHATFNRRRERLDKYGVAGLMDQRHPAPSKVTPEIRGFVVGLRVARPSLRPRDILPLVPERFGVEISERTVKAILSEAGLTSPRPSASPADVDGPAPVPVEEEPAEASAVKDSPESSRDDPPVPTLPARLDDVRPMKGAGLQFLVLASELSGYGQHMARFVRHFGQAVVEAATPAPIDREHKDDRGRFLPEYNGPKPRRDPNVGAVFEDVEHKRKKKDLSRLTFPATRPEIIERKLLSLAALPMVSERGRFDGARDPRGAKLAGLGGIAYMPETLAKFARELKWAGIHEELMEQHAQFWFEHLQSCLGEDPSGVVLYVDTVAKPYWTELYHLSGRVACVGRVMPCVETILVHTGSGVPLLLRTFAGHAPLVKHLLPTLQRLEEAVGQGMISRMSIVDREMVSVELFRAFDACKPSRWFITLLRANQVKDLGRIENLNHLEAYGENEWIGEGTLALRDSKNRDADPYPIRAVVVQREGRSGQRVYVTNAPPEEFPRDLVPTTYRHRWPAQEAVFRNLNGGAAFKSVHGYGKKLVTNVTVVDRMTKLDAQVANLRVRIHKHKEAERNAQRSVHELEVRSRRLDRRLHSARANARRLESSRKTHTKAFARYQDSSSTLASEKSATDAQLALVRKREADATAKTLQTNAALVKKKVQRERLQSKTTIYKTDTVLDQVLSVCKLSLLLLYQMNLHKFFPGRPMHLDTFMNNILSLDGRRILTPTTEIVQFEFNDRNPKVMARLRHACALVNALQHKRNGRVVRFELMDPP